MTPKTNNLSIKAWCAQEVFENGMGKLIKVPGARNLADIFTKLLSAQDMNKHFTTMGFIIYGPRADDDDENDEAKRIKGSRANLMEVRRRALQSSGLGRAARAAVGGGGRLVASALALSSVGVRGATGPLWPGPTFGPGTAVCAVGDNAGDGTTASTSSWPWRSRPPASSSASGRRSATSWVGVRSRCHRHCRCLRHLRCRRHL